MLVTIPYMPIKVRATEERLTRLYEASYAGLKGDSLALAAGMTPHQYRQLCELDPQVEFTVRKGRADSELEHATLLATASRNGDARASLALLQHVHGWQSKEAAASQFGAGGINIIIGDVKTPIHGEAVTVDE